MTKQRNSINIQKCACYVRTSTERPNFQPFLTTIALKFLLEVNVIEISVICQWDHFYFCSAFPPRQQVWVVLKHREEYNWNIIVALVFFYLQFNSSLMEFILRVLLVGTMTWQNNSAECAVVAHPSVLLAVVFVFFCPRIQNIFDFFVRKID